MHSIVLVLCYVVCALSVVRAKARELASILCVTVFVLVSSLGVIKRVRRARSVILSINRELL